MKVAQLKCADWDRNWLHFRGIGSTEPLTLNQSGINSRSGTEPANVGLVLQVSSFSFPLQIILSSSLWNQYCFWHSRWPCILHSVNINLCYWNWYWKVFVQIWIFWNIVQLVQQYFWNTLSIRIWHQLWPCWVDIALLGLCIAVAQDREAGYWEYSLNTWEYSLMDWPPSVASFLEKSFHSKTPVLHWSSLKKLWFTPFFKATNPFEVDVYLQW